MLGPLDIVELPGLGGPEEDKPRGKADEEHEYDKGNDGPKHRVSSKSQSSNFK